MIKNALLGLSKAYARNAGRNALAYALKKTKKPYRTLVRNPVRYLQHPNTKYRFVQKPYNKYLKDPAKKYIRQPYRKVVSEAKLLPNTLNPRRLYHGKTRAHWPHWQQRNPVDVGNLKGLGKWSGGATGLGGMMALTGSPTENPLTYAGGTGAAALAMLLSRGRLGLGRMRFPVAMGAGMGGAYWGHQNDMGYKIGQAEKARLERNKKRMSNLMSENEFLHGSKFGTDPRDARYSRKQYHDINKEQLIRMRGSQQARPDYDEIDFPWWGSKGSDALYGE